EARAVRCAAQSALSGKPETTRIYPDAEGPRFVSDHHGNRALGRRAHGRRTWSAEAPRAQEVRQNVRSRDGMFGMRRTVARPRGARPPGTWREARRRDWAIVLTDVERDRRSSAPDCDNA